MFFKRKRQEDLAKALETSSGRHSQHYWSIVWRRFRKNKPALWSVRMLYVLLFIALFADFIANEKPLYCRFEGQTYFPVLKQYAVDLGWDRWEPRFFSLNWREQDYEAVIWAPITYSYYTLDSRNALFKGPFDQQNVPARRHWHWLGTDEIGRDVAAGMVSGTRTAMLVGVIAMSIASLLGIFFGAIAGYFGDQRFRLTTVRLIANLVALLLGIFYGFIARSFALTESASFGGELLKSLGILGLFFLLANGIARLLERIPGWGRKWPLPVDILVMRLIEVLNSIPGLLLLLAILAVIDQPSIFNIMVIIGFMAWTTIARFIRAELLRIRSLEYVEAAQAMGFSEWRIITRHAIPNALAPVLVSIAFGIAAAILIEATLTFIGIGLPIDQVTWGSLLNEARKDFSAWWIALIPGLAIFFTVTVFNLIGDGLANAMDTRLNQ